LLPASPYPSAAVYNLYGHAPSVDRDRDADRETETAAAVSRKAPGGTDVEDRIIDGLYQGQSTRLIGPGRDPAGSGRVTGRARQLPEDRQVSGVARYGERTEEHRDFRLFAFQGSQRKPNEAVT